MAETWDESKPAGSRSPTLGDDDIREFKRAIRERLAEDHYFEALESPAYGAGGGYQIGKHKYVTLVQYDTAKETESDEIAMRIKDVSGSKEIMITPPSAGTDRQLTKNGGQNINILAADIPSGFISTAMLADSAITGAKINNGAVNASKIGDDSVQANHILDGSVRYYHILDDAVRTNHIYDGNVTTDKLAANALTPEKTSHGFVYIIAIPYSVKEYSRAGTYLTVATFRVKIPAGATGMKGSFNLKASSGTAWAKFGTGGSYSGSASRLAVGYGWADTSSSFNASALTAGTVYTFEIQLASDSGSYTAYLDGFSIWWE